MKHGTVTSYNDHGCRCQACAAANRSYNAARRQRIQGGEVEPTSHSRSGYVQGCRCDTCKAASAEYQVQRRAAVKEGQVSVPHGALRYSAAGCRCRICCAAQVREFGRDQAKAAVRRMRERGRIST